MIKNRVIQLIEFKGIAKERFYKEIGVTSANFRGKAKETPLNSTAIENIFSIVPDLNLEWLITGKGDMLKTDIANNDNNPSFDLQNKLIAMQEKEIARLEKELTDIKSLQQQTGKSPGNVVTRVVDVKEKLT